MIMAVRWVVLDIRDWWEELHDGPARIIGLTDNPGTALVIATSAAQADGVINDLCLLAGGDVIAIGLDRDPDADNDGVHEEGDILFQILGWDESTDAQVAHPGGVLDHKKIHALKPRPETSS